MAIRTALWKVSAQPQALTEAQLPSEKLLENMIVAAPKMLSDEWMLIGRQESTGVGGIIDLLAMVPDGCEYFVSMQWWKTVPSRKRSRRSVCSATRTPSANRARRNGVPPWKD
ncbi:hypothetical protein [Pseudoduganella sp. GCM10020061]|uniref:hypothetical protein n=1 Tax=Pseudoduganella sp. GCM10020061 TaxID=3317345 RepID=UPI00363BB40C